jgi:hypothetical protein
MNAPLISKVDRPLKGVDLSPYLPDLIKFDQPPFVLEIGPLDELRARIWPQLAERTVLTLVCITREIYRELALRALMGEYVPEYNGVDTK